MENHQIKRFTEPKFYLYVSKIWKDWKMIYKFYLVNVLCILKSECMHVTFFLFFTPFQLMVFRRSASQI